MRMFRRSPSLSRIRLIVPYYDHINDRLSSIECPAAFLPLPCSLMCSHAFDRENLEISKSWADQNENQIRNHLQRSEGPSNASIFNLPE